MQNFKYSILIFLSIFSCKSNDTNVVAQYKDYILTRTELQEVIPHNVKKQDSIELANNYIENWLKEKVLLENSSSILSEKNKLDINLKVEDYKNDLITNAIEEKWLSETPPKVPTEQEIKDFYEKNPDILPVKKIVLEYLLINSPKKETEKLKQLLKKNKLDSLQSIVYQKKYPAQLQKEKWIEWKDLAKVLSLPKNVSSDFYLKKNRVFEISQGNQTLLLKITNYAKQGEPAPLSYAKKTLKNILLNKRKLNLLSKKEDELYQKAIYNNEIERK